MKILECISNEHSSSYIIGKKYFAFEEGNVTKISNFPSNKAFFSSPVTSLIPTMFVVVEEIVPGIEKASAEIDIHNNENEPSEQLSLW